MQILDSVLMLLLFIFTLNLNGEECQWRNVFCVLENTKQLPKLCHLRGNGIKHCTGVLKPIQSLWMTNVSSFLKMCNLLLGE